MSHPVKAIEINTPYKICGAATDGYLWKEVNNKIYIRHNSSNRFFALQSHPGKDTMYLIENYPLAVLTNNITAQNIALQVKQYEDDLNTAVENLKEKDTAIENLERENIETQSIVANLRYYDNELIKHKDQIIENLMALKIKKKKEVEDECIKARNFILAGDGKIVFKVLHKDLATAIVSVKKQLASIQIQKEKIQIEKDLAVKEGARCANVLSLHTTILQSVVELLKNMTDAMRVIDENNMVRLNNNTQNAANLLLKENRLILSVLYDDILRMMQLVVEGGGSGNNPKYGYGLSRKYPSRLAVIMQSALPNGVYTLSALAKQLNGDVWAMVFRTVTVISTIEMERRMGSTSYKMKRKLSACSSEFLAQELKRRGAVRTTLEREPKEYLAYSLGTLLIQTEQERNATSLVHSACVLVGNKVRLTWIQHGSGDHVDYRLEMKGALQSYKRFGGRLSKDATATYGDL
jgi:hypothetical protein